MRLTARREPVRGARSSRRSHRARPPLPRRDPRARAARRLRPRGDTARAGRALHGLSPTSAYLFAQALAAASLFGALQREGGRANLQLVCDGPVGGLLVDAEPSGALRGWVRGPRVHFAGDPAGAARAALGGKGYLAVQLDPGDGRTSGA